MFFLILQAQYLIAYCVAVAYVLVLAALFVWVARCCATKIWAAAWPLKLLRIMGDLSSSVLFIPLVYLLLSGFSCSNVRSCRGGPRIVFFYIFFVSPFEIPEPTLQFYCRRERWKWLRGYHSCVCRLPGRVCRSGTSLHQPSCRHESTLG